MFGAELEKKGNYTAQLQYRISQRDTTEDLVLWLFFQNM